MKLAPVLALACILVLSAPAPGQSMAVRWWAVGDGFASSRGGNSGILSAAGQTFVGSSSSGTSTVLSGFLADTLLRRGPVSAVRPDEVLPLAYALGQNYPNPFNPSTTIEFSIPRAGRVTVALYDMLGRLIETLAEADYEPGFYRLEWNARAFASGMYVVRLEAGDFVAARKLLLLK